MRYSFDLFFVKIYFGIKETKALNFIYLPLTQNLIIYTSPMIKSIQLFVLLFTVLFTSCSSSSKKEAVVISSKETFKVHKANAKIVIDGKMDEASWGKTETGSFDNYYEAIEKNDKQKTVFRMLWDDENLYLFYQCEDKFINARETKQDGATYLDDCVELFVTPTPGANKMHFAFEVNLFKTSNDIVFIEDYYQGKKGVIKAFNPKFEREVTIDGTLNDNSDIDKGWTMEMAIPLVTFWGNDGYNPAEVGNKWSFLAIRQELNQSTGERRVASTLYPIESMGEIHDSRSFGLFEFVE
jgi:hypothetical protein